MDGSVECIDLFSGVATSRDKQWVHYVIALVVTLPYTLRDTIIPLEEGGGRGDHVKASSRTTLFTI